MKYCQLFYCRKMRGFFCCHECPRLMACKKEDRDVCLNCQSKCNLNTDKKVLVAKEYLNYAAMQGRQILGVSDLDEML